MFNRKLKKRIEELEKSILNYDYDVFKTLKELENKIYVNKDHIKALEKEVFRNIKEN